MLALVLAVGVALTVAPAARADGDPASDVLAEQPVFIPPDAGIPPARQAQLTALVRDAGARGYPVRVALIAGRSDLGSITALWRRPADYSGFLGSELSLVFRGTLIVVMPAGYGVDVLGGPDPARRLRAAADALRPLPPPGAGPALGDGAIAAVRRAAAAAGVALTVPRAAAAPSAGSSSTSIVPWLALALGLLAIAAAWTASLRARPWRPRSV